MLDDLGWKTMSLEGYRGHAPTVAAPARDGHRLNVSMPFKAIEVSEVVNAVATGQAAWPTFGDVVRIMQMVDACLRSAADRCWVPVHGS